MSRSARLLDLIQTLRRHRRPVTGETLATALDISLRTLYRGLPMLQTPTTMDFGYTFTATDPDGHRLRVFSPAARA